MPVEVRHCHICGATASKAQYQFDECAIVRCQQCSFMWLNPQPTESDVQHVYDGHYFVNDDFLKNDRQHLYGYIDYILERVNKQIQYQRLVREAKEMLPPLPPNTPAYRWLDVGCGLGYLMDSAYDYGFEVFGTELNPYAVDQLRRRYNYWVTCAPVTDASFDRKRFEVISMTDVIEHVHDPRQTIARLHDLTRAQDIIIITTMDSDSLVSRLLGQRLEDFRRTREHLYFFSRQTLTRLLHEEGFDVYLFTQPVIRLNWDSCLTDCN